MERPIERALKGGPVSTLTLVFDGYCGFCTRSVGWIKRLDRRDRVRVLPCQAPDVATTHGLTRANCEAAAWAFAPGGRGYRGAAAVNAAMAAALGTALPLRIYRLPLIRSAQDAAYGWIARNRRRFRGVTPWCVAHPEAGCAEAQPSCAVPLTREPVSRAQLRAP